ncbi:hypothetical protein U1Q18_027772 [Sarracenia purpurea var. burkii]
MRCQQLSSFARYMSNQGFDTWVLEVRGAGLSTEGVKSEVIKPVDALSEHINSSYAGKSSVIGSQIKDLGQSRIIIIEGQLPVSPQFIDWQHRLFRTIEDFQKQLELIAKYNWDFDHYLEEDVPAAVR